MILWPLLAFLLGPVSLKITPQVTLPGNPIWLEAHVTPRADNRLLRLDAEPELAVSEFTLEGEKARLVFRRKWVATEAGSYLIRARVFNGQRQIVGMAQQRLVVAEN